MKVVLRLMKVVLRLRKRRRWWMMGIALWLRKWRRRSEVLGLRTRKRMR
jgi:hypothetical protein